MYTRELASATFNQTENAETQRAFGVPAGPQASLQFGPDTDINPHRMLVEMVIVAFVVLVVAHYAVKLWSRRKRRK